MEHYGSLYLSYAAAVAGWFALSGVFPKLWPKQDPITFPKPWREIGYVLLAGIAVVGIGQLYVRGLRLPNDGAAGPLFESVNQILIFSPMFVLLALRKQPLNTAWIRWDKFGWRIASGLGLALVALLVYSLVRAGADAWWRVVPRVYAYDNLPHAVQVFLEDVAIAMLAVRLSAALGARTTVLLVAALFAAGHIPTMLSNGATPSELTSLVGDALLGVLVIGTAMRSRDIWWLWCVHFAMDMTQFARVSGVGD